MNIYEIKEETGLGKKAIKYYSKNYLGYSDKKDIDYNREDLHKLKKIKIFRELGISSDDLEKILKLSPKEIEKSDIKLHMDSSIFKEQMELFEGFISGTDITEIGIKSSKLNRKKSIQSRILLDFPGLYGKIIISQFSMFFIEPVSREDEKYYIELFDFLDELEIPEINKSSLNRVDEILEIISCEGLDIFQDTYGEYLKNDDEYIEGNIEDYFQEESFKLDIDKVIDTIKKIKNHKDFHEKLILPMRKISSNFDNYYFEMEKIDKQVLKKYNEIIN